MDHSWFFFKIAITNSGLVVRCHWRHIRSEHELKICSCRGESDVHVSFTTTHLKTVLSFFMRPVSVACIPDVTLATESFEQIVRLELVFLVGHHAGHLERQPGLGHLVLEQPLAHGIERRRHHVARAHRPEIVHHEHWTICVRLTLLQVCLLL